MTGKLWLLFVCLLGLKAYDAEVLKIGAIFDKPSPYKEKAFLLAIDDINNRRNIDEDEFLGVIKRIEYDNPFQSLNATCNLLLEGVVGILGPASEDNSNVMQSILDLKEIPHIDVRWDDQPLNGTVVNVYPYPDIMTKVYLTILNEWNWESFVILYENNESLFRVAELLKLFHDSGSRIVVRQLDKNKTGNYRTTLKEVWRSGATHFMLDCSIEILEEVLRQAQQIGLMTSKHHYIITNLDLHTIELTPFTYSETNITGMRFIDPTSETLMEVASQIIFPQIEESDEREYEALKYIAGFKIQLETALVYDAIKMFAEALRIAPKVTPTSINCFESDGGWTSGQTVVNLMKGIEYEGLTGKIRFDNKGFRTDFGLDIIELKEETVAKVGTWNSSEGLNITRSYLNDTRLGGETLINITFIVSTCLTEPYGMLKFSSEPLYGNDRFEGFGIDLIHELSLMEGFNYTFIIREDKQNGKYDPELNKWTGMIGDVIDGVAHLAITDMTITSQRAEVVDFTTPFMNLGISILYQKPTKAPPSFFSFADPFAFEVWKLLAAAYFGVSVALFILGRICPDEWTNPYPCIEEPEYLVNTLSLANCFWFITGSIMQQGSEIAPVAISTRMVAGSWWFFTLIMVSSYTANLAAFLTTESPDSQFNNVFELVKNAEEKGIKYGAKLDGATFNFFRNATNNEVYQQIYRYMEEHKSEVMVLDNKDGVIKAMNEKYAFFMESVSIEYETQRRCELNQVGSLLDEKGYGIAMRKNSPYRNPLSKAILRLQETGKLAALKRKWWEERRGGGQCAGEDDNSEATPLNLKNVEGVFWVSIGGTVLACIVVMIEFISYVGKECVKTKTPFRAALVEELKFYFRFSGMVKPVVYNHSEKDSNSRKSEEDGDEVAFNFANNGESKSNKSNEKRRDYRKQDSTKSY